MATPGRVEGVTTRNGPFRTLAPGLVLILIVALLTSCGSDGDNSAEEGFALVSPGDAAALLEDRPADLIVLDVRTPDEYDEGHIDGSIMLDFYEADFADRLAQLDPEVPYLVYCRSGNRSGQTTQLMEDLGFSTVYDVDGGVIAWAEAGLPLSDS